MNWRLFRIFRSVLGARQHLNSHIFNTNHESPKERNHERKSNGNARGSLAIHDLKFFVLSFFRAFRDDAFVFVASAVAHLPLRFRENLLAFLHANRNNSN